MATTARHYARWAGGDLYREPLRLAPGEVPADFLARLGEKRPQSDPTWVVGGGGDPLGTEVNQEVRWIPGEDLNLHSQIQSLLSCR